MLSSFLRVILGVAAVTHACKETPKGLHFIGVGYNLLEGNHEGGDLRVGGVDPGLLFTRKIFKLSYDTNKLSVDKRYSVPDQVSFAPRDSCVSTESKDVVSGAESYRKDLSVDVTASGKDKKNGISSNNGLNRNANVISKHKIPLH